MEPLPKPPQPKPAQPQPVPRQQQASQPTSEAQQSDQEEKPRLFSKLGLTIGGVILALVVGAGLYFTGSSSDDPTPAQIAQMESSWAAALQNKVSLPSVQPQDLAEALTTMKLPEKEREALQAEISDGQIDLVWVTLWDNMVEDGDVVSLHSDGVTIVVPLLKKPTRIALPRPTKGVINLTGVRDGGGGITLGLMSGPDQVLIPPMAPGQVVGIPVR